MGMGTDVAETGSGRDSNCVDRVGIGKNYCPSAALWAHVAEEELCSVF